MNTTEERQLDNNRDFNIPLSVTDRQTTQKISKDIEDFNNTINQPT